MMNDEIKEILDDLLFTTTLPNVSIKLNKEKLNQLLDYITNLQQENISLAKENKQEKQFIKDCGFENVQQLALDYIGIRQEKEDYKSRCEKAVEYMKNTFDITSVKDMFDIMNKLEDILNGDKSE